MTKIADQKVLPAGARFYSPYASPVPPMPIKALWAFHLFGLDHIQQNYMLKDSILQSLSDGLEKLINPNEIPSHNLAITIWEDDLWFL